jgi:hypothetical protein
MTVLLAAAPSPLWYVTRASGTVTLVLLTGSVSLGVATFRGTQLPRIPRFVVAVLHRNLTLLAVVFLAVHIVTTIADAYTSIGLRDAFVPFVSNYRPVWLGLGALACDLLLALVVTSLLREHIGYRAWRATHWLAYLSWPLALVHGLGTGSDARFGWMAALSFGCVVAVVASAGWRVASGTAPALRRAALGTTVAGLALAVGFWYRSGPAQHGWAARAGTPTVALASSSVRTPVHNRSGRTRPAARFPRRFSGSLSGKLTETAADANGLVTIRIDAALHGGVPGQLRLALRGFASGDGGVSLTSSGVAFADIKRTALYEGGIVALAGNQLTALVSSTSNDKLDLRLVLQIGSDNSVTGTLDGSRV